MFIILFLKLPFVIGILVIAFLSRAPFFVVVAISMKMFSFNQLFSVSVFVNFCR